MLNQAYKYCKLYCIVYVYEIQYFSIDVNIIME